MPGAKEPFDPGSLIERLARAGVDFVVIGAVAGGAHGSSYGTFDLDIAFRDDPANLSRLAAVLNEIGADRPPEAPAFSAQTSLGRLKCFVAPNGAPPYEALRDGAWPIEVGNSTGRIASLDHLIAMKEAGHRTRDEILAMLYKTISDVVRAPRDA